MVWEYVLVFKETDHVNMLVFENTGVLPVCNFGLICYWLKSNVMLEVR